MTIWVRRVALRWSMRIAGRLAVDVVLIELLDRCERGIQSIKFDKQTFIVGGVVQCRDRDEAERVYGVLYSAMSRKQE